MDDRIMWTLDKLRDFFGKPIIVNNWKAGGTFDQRGYRDDPATGAKYSAHRFGRAVDFDITGTTAEQFRQMVKKGALANELKHITRIEETAKGKPITWIHIDCEGLPRNAGEKIVFINA